MQKGKCHPPAKRGWTKTNHKPSLVKLEAFMKNRIAAALILIASLNATFGTISTLLDYSKDSIDARLAVQDRTILKSMRAEYDDILSSRICLLKYDGVKNCFGRKLFWTPSDCALPLFAENAAAQTGFTTSPNKRHTDFNAIGDLGYVEIFYNSDGESIGDAAIYFRTDEQFVPLQSTNDYYKRVSWEMTKFNAMKEWLNQHLPKVKDLGTVEVTNTPPNSISRGGGNRIDLGDGKICVIQIQPLTYSPGFLKFVLQAITNDYFSANLYLDSANSDGHLKDLGVRVSPKSMGFVVDGQFYRLTLKHKQSSPEPAPAR